MAPSKRARLVLMVAAAALMCGCGGATGGTAASSQSTRATSSARTGSPAVSANGSQWLTLPGQMVADTDSALLLSGGSATSQYTLIGTTSQWQRTLAPGPVLAPAVIDNNGSYEEDAVLTAADAGYPDGTTLMSVAATAPASGLTPANDSYYLLQFNNETGALVTKVDLGTASFNQEPVPVATGNGYASVVGTTSGTIVLELVSLASGKVTARRTIPSADYDDSYGRYVLLTIERPVCDLLDVYDTATLSRVSANRICIPGGVPAGQVFGGVATGHFLSATEYSGQADPNEDSFPFSVMTGAQLGRDLPASGAGLEETVGPRSTLGIAWDSTLNGGTPADAGFYQVATWSRVFRVHNSQALGFSCAGIADNDVWVTTTSGNIVVNGFTGTQIASGWQLYPVAGGVGWTVFDGPQSSSGQQQYLLRSTQPAVNALASAPTPTSA